MSAPLQHGNATYKSIHQQPDVLRDVLQREWPNARRAAEVIAGAHRVYLTGTGTSSHAAHVTEYLYRSLGIPAEARSAFDLANYGPRLRPDDVVVVISHRGSKRYGNRVLELAKESGTPMIGVTGLESPMLSPEVVLHTAPHELSSMHTMSYTGNLLALDMIGVELSERSSGVPHDLRPLLETLPDLVGELLQRESEVLPVAEVLGRSGRLVLAGAGPDAYTAREGALKVKESSYLTAEGFEIENLLHGGLQALRPGDVGVVIWPQGPASSRAKDLVRALELLGATVFVVHPDKEKAGAEVPTEASSTPFVFRVPGVPELIGPMLTVIPLQLLACFTAEGLGRNPDSFREDDPLFKRISDSYTL